jgi:hypothetical protein
MGIRWLIRHSVLLRFMRFSVCAGSSSSFAFLALLLPYFRIGTPVPSLPFSAAFFAVPVSRRICIDVITVKLVAALTVRFALQVMAVLFHHVHGVLSSSAEPQMIRVEALRLSQVWQTHLSFGGIPCSAIHIALCVV